MFFSPKSRLLQRRRAVEEEEEGGSNQTAEPPLDPNDDDVRMMQSQTSDIPIASYSSSSSNNLMNTNLSGSLKRFNRHLRPNIDEGDSDDEDEENAAEHYTEYSDATSHTIYAPISSSQPIINPYNEQYHHQQQPGTSQHQRIAVAALPNLDFDPISTMSSRAFSASTPSMHSTNDGGGSLDSNGQPRRDFTRNATASSSNYFV